MKTVFSIVAVSVGLTMAMDIRGADAQAELGKAVTSSASIGPSPSGFLTASTRTAPQNAALSTLQRYEGAGATKNVIDPPWSLQNVETVLRHYYAAILGRKPDSEGRAFWRAEAVRMMSLGASIKEVWFAMAMQFYQSPEYRASAPADDQYIASLYRTFFDREPDPDGSAYWSSQLKRGMPRGIAVSSFMFSPEFEAFMNSMFAAATVRPENDTVTDFYRGLLQRLPDSEGFTHWLARFRNAQCAGSFALHGEVDAISALFLSSSEYATRATSNEDYISDLYNAFLRRGGDLEGIRFWLARLDGGELTRDQLRLEFLASPEFSGRVDAIVGAGCVR